jgi:hypothetical protein
LTETETYSIRRSKTADIKFQGDQLKGFYFVTCKPTDIVKLINVGFETGMAREKSVF